MALAGYDGKQNSWQNARHLFQPLKEIPFMQIIPPDIAELSSAESTSLELKKSGINPGEISFIHIESIYKNLKKVDAAPDFSAVPEIIKGNTRNIPLVSQLWGVIVETRKHPDLERVIKNFSNAFNMPIQLFHGRSNIDFILSTSIAQMVDDGLVYLTTLDVNEFMASAYNATLLSKGFWENIIGREKILVFQTDAISCQKSDYTINDFIDYDYIGSGWRRRRPVGLIIDGGNGGVSLRDWKKSYSCLDRFPVENWRGGEDGYFAFHIELIGGKVGKQEECAKFSTQRQFLFKSLFAHKISHLQPSDLANFIEYCPESLFMIDSKC